MNYIEFLEEEIKYLNGNNLIIIQRDGSFTPGANIDNEIKILKTFDSGNNDNKSYVRGIVTSEKCYLFNQGMNYKKLSYDLIMKLPSHEYVLKNEVFGSLKDKSQINAQERFSIGIATGSLFPFIGSINISEDDIEQIKKIEKIKINFDGDLISSENIKPSFIRNLPEFRSLKDDRQIIKKIISHWEWFDNVYNNFTSELTKVLNKQFFDFDPRN